MTSEVAEQWKAWDAVMDAIEKNDQATMGELARGLNATAKLLQALHNEVKEFAITQATFRLTMTAVEETLRELKKSITASDPTSIPIRLVILEREFEATKEWRKVQDNRMEIAGQERTQSSWHLRIALTTAGISFIGSIVVMILSFLMRK